MAKPTKKRKAGDRGIINGVEFEVGSDNIFADFGLPDAEEQLAKSTLASLITRTVEQNGWDQKTAAERLGTHQPVISDIKRGKLRSITYDRLMGWLNLLGWSVEIKVAQARKPHIEVAVPA